MIISKAFKYFIFFLLISSIAQASDKFIIKLATLAPEGSVWMNAFHDLNKEVIKRTNGDVRFKFYPGGVLGDEIDMLRKIRIGQIHGGGFTGLGLGMIYKDVLVIQLPFLFNNYHEVDYVLKRMEGRFRKGFEKNGFVLLGWSDIGFVYLLSNSPIRSKRDTRGLKFWIWEGDKVASAVFKRLDIVPVPLGLPDILMALQTGLVDVVFSSPLGAIALQWFTRVKYMMDLPLTYAIGAVLISKRAFQRIPPNYQKIIRECANKYIQELNQRIREDNEKAKEIMIKHGIKITRPSKEDVAEFKKMCNTIAKGFSGKAFSREVLNELMFYLNEYRSHEENK